MNDALLKAAETMSTFYELQATGCVELTESGFIVRCNCPRVQKWQQTIPRGDADLLTRGALLAGVRAMLRHAPRHSLRALVAFAHRIEAMPMAEVEAQLGALDERRQERHTFH